MKGRREKEEGKDRQTMQVCSIIRTKTVSSDPSHFCFPTLFSFISVSPLSIFSVIVYDGTWAPCVAIYLLLSSLWFTTPAAVFYNIRSWFMYPVCVCFPSYPSFLVYPPPDSLAAPSLTCTLYLWQCMLLCHTWPSKRESMASLASWGFMVYRVLYLFHEATFLGRFCGAGWGNRYPSILRQNHNKMMKIKL